LTYLPLWKILKSNGIILPNIWKIKNVPNHQPGCYPWVLGKLVEIVTKYGLCLMVFCNGNFPGCLMADGYTPIYLSRGSSPRSTFYGWQVTWRGLDTLHNTLPFSCLG
jgi:hypothetical protein